MSMNYETRLAEIFGVDLANALLVANADDTVKSIVGSSSGADDHYLSTKGGRDRTVSDLRALVKNELNSVTPSAQADNAVTIPTDSSEEGGTETVGSYSPDAVDPATAPEPEKFDAAEYRKGKNIPAEWTDAEVEEYALAGGEDRGLTLNLNHIVDPTRKHRQLTRGELVDALAGAFDEYTEADHAKLVEQLRKVEHVPDAWTVRAVVEYVRMQLIPPKAQDDSITTDVWVEDVSRANRQPEAWSDDELRAWILRLIPAVGVSTDQKLAIEAKRRFKLEADNTADAVREAYRKKTSAPEHATLAPAPAAAPAEAAAVNPVSVATVADSSTLALLNGLTALNQTYIIDSLRRYEEEGKVGKANTPASGKALQEMLDNVIRYCINLKDNAGFMSAMDYLMAFIKKHQTKGQLFSYDYVYRWTGYLRSGVIQESHKELLQLMVLMNDDNALVRQQVDVSAYLKHLDHVVQQRLMAYFEAKK